MTKNDFNYISSISNLNTQEDKVTPPLRRPLETTDEEVNNNCKVVL